MKINRECWIRRGIFCRWVGAYLLTLFMFVVPLSADASGQQVSLRLENVSLREAFKEIRKQLGYKLAYNDQVLRENTQVSVNVSSGNIHDVMTQDRKSVV